MATATILNNNLRSSPDQCPDNYVVFWHLWPQQAVVDDERRQVGFELELMGSHSPDAGHLDPECIKCSGLRSALVSVAEQLADKILSEFGDSVTAEVDPHAASIICLPSLAYRACITVSVIFAHKQLLDGDDARDESMLARLRQYLVELTIPEH